MLILGLMVGTVLYNRYRSTAFILVFTWAYAAIAVKQSTMPTVQLAAGAGAIVAVLLAIYGLIAPKRRQVSF